MRAYFDGNISKDDWLSLKAILEFYAKRSNHQAAWLFLKNQYWKLAFSKRPEKELYDLINDPDCMINVANQEKYDSIQKNLNNQMFAALKDQGDPRVLGNGDIFDNYLYADTKHQNIYYRFNKGEISAGSAKWVNESDFEK